MSENHKNVDYLKNVGKSLVTIIQELRADKGLMQLLLSNKNRPYEDMSITDAFIEKQTAPDLNILSPFPFNELAQVADVSQLRVFSANTYLSSNNIISDTGIVFEILIPKSLWLIWDENGDSTIRPYEISARILNVLLDKNLKGLGKLKFDGFSQISVGTSFEGIRLFAKYWTIENSGSTI